MSHSSRIINHGTGHGVYEIASGGALCAQGIAFKIFNIFCILAGRLYFYQSQLLQ